MLNAEKVKQIQKEISEYEKTHFGIRFGQDFNEFATVFAQDPNLEAAAAEVFIRSAVSLMRPDAVPEPTREGIADFVKNTPAFNKLVEFAYIGYRIGREAFEIEELERMRSGSKTGEAERK